MSKRLSDTAALKSQGIKEAGAEFASERPSYFGPNEGNPLTPATDSADYAVGAESREKARIARMNSPYPFVDPSERAESRRKTGAGDSSLSAAVRICRE